MRFLFKKLGFGGNSSAVDYDRAKELMRSDDVGERMALAQDSRTHPEILYYLAESDPDVSVRRAVLNNDALPMQVSGVFSRDEDDDIRMVLAGRLVELLPELSEEKQGKLYAFAVQAMGTLALDEVLKVRVALSSAIKDCAFAPPKLALQLAKDVEQEVSEPILRYCSALSDGDLLEILAEYPEGWAVEAIAQRESVSGDVSMAVIECRDVESGRQLIKNRGATLTKRVVERIVEAARFFPEWQKPVALRKELPVELALKMADFVDLSVRTILMAREDFDGDTVEEISEVFKRRTEMIEQTKVEGLGAEDRLNLAIKDGRLNEEVILDALAVRDRDFVILAIARLAKIEVAEVERIVGLKAAKPVVAMTWKAGLSMRAALQFEKDLAFVRAGELLYPRDGVDYPMDDVDLEWQLDLLGI